MPIYEYRCSACGFQKEYLQKMGDALLTDCPECASASLRKMVTAAGFQLKGSGWYATDFKNGSQTRSESQGKPAAKIDAKPAPKSEEKSTAKSEENSQAKSDDKPASGTPAKKPDAAPAQTSGAGASPV